MERVVPCETSAVDVVRHFRMFSCQSCTQVIDVVRKTFEAWIEDKAPRLGAALAFYSALSLAPLLIVILGVAGLVYGQAAVQGQLVWQIRDLCGPEGAQAIQSLIRAAHRPSSGIIATVVGLVTLFFGASSVVVELTDALNTIWHVPSVTAQDRFTTVLRFAKQRFVSFSMVLGIGFLLLISLFVSAWISAVGKFFSSWLPVPGIALQLAYLVFSTIVIGFLFAIIYKVLPDVYLKWSDVAIGAAATSLLFSLGKFLIALYLGRTTIASTYGAAGSFLIVLLWVYYSAQVFFLGAEFTKIYTERYGSKFSAQLQVQPERLESNLIVNPSRSTSVLKG